MIPDYRDQWIERVTKRTRNMTTLSHWCESTLSGEYLTECGRFMAPVNPRGEVVVAPVDRQRCQGCHGPKAVS